MLKGGWLLSESSPFSRYFGSVSFLLLFPFYHQLLYQVARTLGGDKKRDPEFFSSRPQAADGVFHRGFAAFMDDRESFGRIGYEKILHDLGRLYFTAGIYVSQDIEFQIACEPGG